MDQQKRGQPRDYPSIPSTSHSTSYGSYSVVMSEREVSAPAAVGGGESVVGMATGQGHGAVQRDRMERRVTDAIFNRPLQTSVAVAHVPTKAASTVSFHSSYHGETTDQLRNQSRTTSSQNWDARQSRSTAVGVTPSSSRPAYSTPHYPQTSPPPFTTSPSAAPIPTPSHNIPTGPSPQQQQLHQSVSQEWTEYTSAPTDGTRTLPSATFSPTPSSQGTSHEGLDISEFDPIQS